MKYGRLGRYVGAVGIATMLTFGGCAETREYRGPPEHKEDPTIEFGKHLTIESILHNIFFK